MHDIIITEREVRKMKQIKFHEVGENIEIGGILLDDGNIVCGCCGSLFEPEDVEIIREYENWIDLSEEIKGDE